MKPSNRKQVIVLSVVAVGALAFLGNSLLGIGQSVVAKLVQATASPTRADQPPPVATELFGDPFSHPKLTLAESVKPPSPATSASPPVVTPPAMGGDVNALPGTEPLRPTFQVVPELGGEPAEITGFNRKEEEKSGPRVALTAVVKVNMPTAFLSLNGGESHSFRAGDLIAPGLRLASIGDGYVNIRSPKATYRIAVGQEIQP